MTGECFFGSDGKPCLDKNGYAAWTATYDERGNRTSMSCFGIQGEPVIAPTLGYHRILTKYDQNWGISRSPILRLPRQAAHRG